MTTYYFTEEDIKLAIAKCDKRIASLHREQQKVGLPVGLGTICLSGVKTEKLIYTSILNPNTNKEIFKLLLAKFDELVNNTYDISGDMVREGKWEEGRYIDYCKESLDHRKYIYRMCCIGYGKVF
jgi:hypothetical protein